MEKGGVRGLWGGKRCADWRGRFVGRVDEEEEGEGFWLAGWWGGDVVACFLVRVGAGKRTSMREE